MKMDMALLLFEEIIDKNSVVLEFGSGASTLWLAERTWLTVSIEHDEEWFKEVSRKLCGGTPQMYLVKPEDYPQASGKFPDEMFDVVFVDCYDKYRTPIIKSSLGKIKPGGWLVIDDTNWPMMRGVVNTIGRKWEREDYNGIKHGRHDGKVTRSTTTFLRKPGGK